MKIRPFFKSTEFLFLPVLSALFFYILPINLFLKGFSIICDGYILGRSIYKLGRGLTYTAVKTSEGYVFVVNIISILFGLLSGNLNQNEFLWMSVLAYVIYSISRNLTKKLRALNSNVSNVAMMGR